MFEGTCRINDQRLICSDNGAKVSEFKAERRLHAARTGHTVGASLRLGIARELLASKGVDASRLVGIASEEPLHLGRPPSLNT